MKIPEELAKQLLEIKEQENKKHKLDKILDTMFKIFWMCWIGVMIAYLLFAPLILNK